MIKIHSFRDPEFPVGLGGNGGAALAQGVRALYQQAQTDYWLEPLVWAGSDGKPMGRIKAGDTVIFCCRRGEREIQLTEAFTQPEFNHFARPDFLNLTFVLLTLYHEKFKHLPVAFAPERFGHTLGETVSQAGLRQLRVAESEKFAHVTFFLDGSRSQPFPGQVNLCVASPKGIPYDQAPALSLAQVAHEVIHGLQQGYNLIVTNFANGDVIGHISDQAVKIQCAQIVDAHLGEVVKAALAAEYTVLVTADHGNLEEMVQPNGTPHGSHTNNPVPFLLIDRDMSGLVESCDAKLADIAPTILALLGIPQPDLMTGTSLWKPDGAAVRRRVLLVILDGWGIGRQDDTNPIFLANTPVWDDLTRRYSFTQLQAAGEAVGLMEGKAGNSEAGHMNIGAGRVVLQDDVNLEKAIYNGSFITNPVLQDAMMVTRQRNASLHLIALLSERSSHGSVDYPLALLKMARARGLEQVFLHMIFDGRSSEPGTAPVMLERLAGQMAEIGTGQIVSGIGRGYALDRDGNYERTRLAYEAFVFGIGQKYCLV